VLADISLPVAFGMQHNLRAVCLPGLLSGLLCTDPTAPVGS
jgi:hypothetical protein